MTTNLENAFGGDDSTVLAQVGKLAEHVALEMQGCDVDGKALTERKAALDASKEKLNKMMVEAGMRSCKLECGLTPSAVTKMRYYPVCGISSPEMFQYLEDVNLGDIIKPTVNFNTLQSTLKEYEGQGHDIPESVVKKSPQYTVRMGGKSAFLAERGEK